MYWRDWFEHAAHIGMDGRYLPEDFTCMFWEQMYEAFKARMIAEASTQGEDQ